MDDPAEPSEEMLQLELAELRQEHADLDAAIQAVTMSPLPDMMLIRRLKRKKLFLKDEIVRVQELITPDILA